MKSSYWTKKHLLERADTFLQLEFTALHHSACVLQLNENVGVHATWYFILFFVVPPHRLGWYNKLLPENCITIYTICTAVTADLSMFFANGFRCLPGSEMQQLSLVDSKRRVSSIIWIICPVVWIMEPPRGGHQPIISDWPVR